MTVFASLATLAAIISLATPAALAQTADRQSVDPDEIRALESRLMRAVHGRDHDQLDRLLAADYVLRGSPDIDRKMWLENALTRCWGDRSDLDKFRLRRQGDVAIASFELTFYRDPTTCQAAVLRSLVTDVRVREPDGWRLKIRHAGAPPRPDADVAGQYGIVPDAPPAWEANSELSVVATSGNTSTRTLGLGAELVHRTNGARTDVSTALLTAQADGVTKARSVSVRGRHGVALSERVQTFR